MTQTRTRRAPEADERYTPEQVLEFIIENKETIYDTLPDLEERHLNKLNSIASLNSEIFNEAYEFRYKIEEKMKYIHIRCKEKKCEFNVWYTFDGLIDDPKSIKHFRHSYISHSRKVHKEAEN